MKLFSKSLAAGTLAIAAFAVTLPMATPADAQGRLFGRDAVGLTEQDNNLINQALKSALEEYKSGGQYPWENEAGTRAGVVETVDLFSRGTMPCIELVHSFTKGGGRSYRAPFCQVESGEWKLAF